MKQYFFKLNREQFEVSNPIITGAEILTTGGLEPVEDYELLIKINEKGFEPVQLNEAINLQEPGIEGFTARPYRKIVIKVDDIPFEVEEVFMTPNEILTLAGRNIEEVYLKQIIGNREIGYKNDREHKIAIRNNQVFTTCTPIIILIVNGTPKEWHDEKISFRDVVILAFGEYIDNPNMVYTVAYEDGPVQNPEGSMIKNSSVYVQNNMIFHATATDKS
jgi:hypothetical protein